MLLLFVDWMVCKLLSTLLALRLSHFHASVPLGVNPAEILSKEIIHAMVRQNPKFANTQ
jgi:hypothetical protein